MSSLLYPGGKNNPSVYNLTYDLDQKGRKDWSGNQLQLWTSPQRTPMKTKFPYWVKTEQVSGYWNERGKFTNRSRWEDRSGGKWYFEEELIFATPADKYRNNSSMDGYTGGKILMTKLEAAQMGLTPDQILNFYRQDEQFKKAADQVGREPAFFFEYRKDGSIIGMFKPPIVPPPAPVQVPNPLAEPLQVLHEQLIEAQLTPEIIQAAIANPQMVQPAPPPEPEPVPVSTVNPYQLTTTIEPKWILLAIVGVGILSALIFIMRRK